MRLSSLPSSVVTSLFINSYCEIGIAEIRSMDGHELIYKKYFAMNSFFFLDDEACQNIDEDMKIYLVKLGYQYSGTEAIWTRN